MSNIVKFPGADPVVGSSRAVEPEPKPVSETKSSKPFFGWVVRFFWVAVVLMWPVAKWVLSIATFYRLVMAMVHWENPASNAGWVFLAHFAVLVALTMFVSTYRPKGLE